MYDTPHIAVNKVFLCDAVQAVRQTKTRGDNQLSLKVKLLNH